MELEKILAAVPIRKPMLCIDDISQIKYGVSVEGYREVMGNEDWAVGHFIEEPIFPGTLIIETMAQIGAFIFYDIQKPQTLKSYLGKVNQIKFLQKVEPDCRLVIHAELVMKLGKMAQIRCDAKVDEQLVAHGELTLFYIEDI